MLNVVGMFFFQGNSHDLIVKLFGFVSYDDLCTCLFWMQTKTER